MFIRLTDAFRRNIVNVILRSGEILSSHIVCRNQPNETHRQYDFDHTGKTLDLNYVRQQHYNSQTKSVDIAENNNTWNVSYWVVVVSCILGFLLMNSEVRADEEKLANQKINKTVLVTRENFQKINIQLQNDNPSISSLKMEFKATQNELEELYDSIKENTELGYILWDKGQGLYEVSEKIENRLKENNQNYQYHPNDYMHALLSAHAYINSEEKDEVLLDELSLDYNTKEALKDWYVDKVHNYVDENGYYGVIYKNEKTHQIVLANRGTEGGAMGVITDMFKRNSDWNTNLKEIFIGQIIVGQQACNYKATEDAVEIAKTTGYRLSFAGHSLGAWLTELSAFYSHAYFKFRNIKAVTFDSPGALPMMEKLQSNIKSRQTQVDLDDIEIVTYLAAKPNPVNCGNEHGGRVYKMEVEMGYTDLVDKILPTWIKNQAGNTIKGFLAAEGHSLTGIIAAFDPVTGKPKNYQRMSDWPRFKYKGDAQEFGDTGLLKKIALGPIYYLVRDKTLMTMIGLIKKILIDDEVNQEQYWTYFEQIDWEKEEEETLELRSKLRFDNRFALIAKAKYREGDDNYIMNPTKGSLDEYLYELYKYKATSGAYKKIPKTVKIQLVDILRSFTIEESINDGKHKLVPNEKCDVENIRQGARRLFSVLPKNVLQSLWFNADMVTCDRLILPDNLPLAPSDYTEIRDKREELEDKIGKKSVVALSGAGGMGKSTLAAEYGRNCKKRNWQVRWIKGMQIEEEFLKLAKDLNIDIANLRPEEVRDAVYKEFHKFSKVQQVLLIFDNVEDGEKMKEYLRNLSNHMKVLVTARDRDLLEGIKSIPVRGFETEEAVSYLRKALEKNIIESEKLVTVIGESPFRLSSAVAYLKKHSLKSVDEFLREYEEIKKGQKHDLEIYPEVELLFRDLKKECPEGWRLLKYLAYLDAEGVSLQLIQNIMVQEMEVLQNAVNQLERLSLINVLTEGGQKILKVSHRIVQTETRKALAEENKTQIEEILRKLISELDKVFPNVNENPENWDGMNELVGHAKILIKETEKTDMPIVERINLLNKVGSYYYHIVFDYKEALCYWEEKLAWKKRINTGNHPDIAASLNNVGSAYQALRGEENIRIGLKYQEESLKMKQALFSGNHPGIAASLNNIGSAYQTLGGDANIRKGLKYQEKSLKMKQALFPENHPSVADSLYNVGIAYETLGGDANIRKGLKYLEESLKMHQALFSGNHPGIADSLNSVGVAYEALGGEENIRKGLMYQEESLKMKQTLFSGNHLGIADSLNNVGSAYQTLGGEENIRRGLKYQEESLKMRQALFSGNHPGIADSLNNVGSAYRALGGDENIRKGLKYQEESLKMKQALFSGNYPDIADSLNNVGSAYEALGGEENIRKGLMYQEESLEMRQVLFSGNHPDIADSLNNVGSAYHALGGDENIRIGLKYQEESLKMKQALFPGNHPNIANSLNNVGGAYQSLGGEKNIRKGLKYLEESLKMRQALFSGNHLDIADSLNNIGSTYQTLGGEENIRKGLKYLENSLKMKQALFSGNHPGIVDSLHNVGIAYLALDDIDKFLEYFKQAYSIRIVIFEKDNEKTKQIKSIIERLQPKFFTEQGLRQTLQEYDCLGGNKVGFECRWIISSRETSNDDLIKLKRKIQNNVLNEIVKTVDLGVKGYAEKGYLKDKLEALGNKNENVELAQMLCFESMNLGIMKSEKKPYTVVEEFTRNNPELVKKIAEQHPEFFVDGSIVEACVRAMPDDKFFQQHIFDHVKYMGMEERREKLLKTASGF